MYRVGLSDLMTMSPHQHEAAVARLAKGFGSPNPEARARLERRVREFEARYDVSSEQLMAELVDGNRSETAEVSEWLFLLGALGHHVAG